MNVPAVADATPLQLIERAVLERAKDIRLDLDDDAARARLVGIAHQVEDRLADLSLVDDQPRQVRRHL